MEDKKKYYEKNLVLFLIFLAKVHMNTQKNKKGERMLSKKENKLAFIERCDLHRDIYVIVKFEIILSSFLLELFNEFCLYL